MLKLPNHSLIHLQSRKDRCLPSLCWKQTLARRIKMKGSPFCSHPITAFNSERAGAGVPACSSLPSSVCPWRSPPAMCSRDEPRWWPWWKWWDDCRWWKGAPSVRLLPSSLGAGIWMNTSPPPAEEPRTKPDWNGVAVMVPEGMLAKPENNCCGEEASAFRLSKTPLSSTLVSELTVWLRFLQWTEMKVIKPKWVLQNFSVLQPSPNCHLLRVPHTLSEHEGLQMTDVFPSICCWKVGVAELEASNQIIRPGHLERTDHNATVPS